MTLHLARNLSNHSVSSAFPDAFRPWRAQLLRDGIPPVIAIAGSRGKSTVVNLLAAMFDHAGLAWATKTDAGVTIRGAIQPDSTAWLRIEQGLISGAFDIAIEELDWTDVAAIEGDETRYALAAITNVCANREECLIQDEARLAVKSLARLHAVTAPAGTLVLSGEDIAVIGEDVDNSRTTIFVAQNMQSPMLQIHLESGGIGSWCDGALHCGALGNLSSYGAVEDSAFLLHGAAGFQISNVLTAIAAAASCGLPAPVIRRAIESFTPNVEQEIAVFHASDVNGVRVVVDRPNPSWHLRQIVRALRDAKAPRIISIVGQLESVSENDLAEVGRILGRLSNVLVMHSSGVDEERVNLLRHGVAQNSMPPVIVHISSEQRAISVALDRARRDDLIFVLADDPAMVHREISSIRCAADSQAASHTETAVI